MDIATQARLNELLLEREELLLRIHALETRACELLGEPWPFEAPAIPSASPRRKARPQPRARETGPAAVPAAGQATQRLVPRPLSGPGDSWLVVYEQHGRLHEERHDNPAALATLLASQGETLRVLRVE